MQLFLLGAGTTAGKPAQLLHVLVTAADYCFVYNGSTVRPRARPGPVVLGAAHTRRGTRARQDAAAHSECPRHGKPYAALGFCSLAGEFTVRPAFLPQHLCNGILHVT